MANPWFRLYHEFATDPKVQMLSEVLQRRFIMLLCLRCCNGDETLQDVEVAFQLRISVDEYAETKAALMAKKLIDKDNKPIAWGKRQFDSDSSTPRVKAYRDRKKSERNADETLQQQQGSGEETKRNVIDTEADTETDTEVVGDKSPPVGAKALDCPHQEIIALYNRILPELEQVLPTRWAGARAKHLQARWRESPKHQRLEFWERFFTALRELPWYLGENKSEWRANLGWIVKRENFDKLIEKLTDNARRAQHENRPHTAAAQH